MSAAAGKRNGAALSRHWDQFGDEGAASELSWLVKDYIPEGAFGILYAPPSSAKTFLVVEIAMSIACGESWADRRVMQGTVMLFLPESPRRVTNQLRAARLRYASRADGGPLFLSPDPVNIYDGPDVEAIVADANKLAAKTGRPIVLMVFDTWARSIGAADEDKAKDVNRCIEAVSRIQRAVGCAVLVVAHAGKTIERGVRGSTAFLAAADVVLRTQRREGGGFELFVEKLKDGLEPKPIRFALEQVQLGEDEDGEPITSAVVVMGETGRPVLSKAAAIALKALQTTTEARGGEAVRESDWEEAAASLGISKSEVRNSVGKTFDRARARLRTLGMIVQDADGRWRPTEGAGA